jgi:hypothetical protein
MNPDLSSLRVKALFGALFCLSAATLAFEIWLMRFMAVYLWSTLAQGIISVALLGFGVVGPLLIRFRDSGWVRWMLGSVLGFCWVMFLSPAILKALPLNPYALAVSITYWIPLLSLMGCLFLPFLGVGVFTALTFKKLAEQTGTVYAVNLVGAGFGALLAMLLAPSLWPEQLFGVVAGLGMAGSFCLSSSLLQGFKIPVFFALCCLPLAGLPFLDVEMPFSQYKDIAVFRNHPETQNLGKASSSLGVLEWVASPVLHDLMDVGLGPASSAELPLQTGVFLNGNLLTSVTPGSHPIHKGSLTLWALQHLRPDSLLILGALSGWEADLATAEGVPSVVAHDELRLRSTLRNMFSGQGGLGSEEGLDLPGPLSSQVRWDSRPLLELLHGSSDLFSMILLPKQAFRSPHRNAIHTVENYQAILDHLEDSGVWVIVVPLHSPPREEVRTLANVLAALHGRVPKEAIQPSLWVFRDHRQMMIWVKPRGWSDIRSGAGTVGEGLTGVQQRASSLGLDWVYAAGRPGDVAQFKHLPESPLYHQIVQALTHNPRSDLSFATPFHVSLTPRNRPYFDTFVDVSSLLKLRDLFGPRMSAYFQLKEWMDLMILGLMILAGGALVWIPSMLQYRREKKGSVGPFWRVGGYFAALGLGYMAVEIALMEALSVWVFGEPVTAAGLVLTVMLAGSGIGASLTGRKTNVIQASRFPAWVCFFSALWMALTLWILYGLQVWLVSLPYGVQLGLTGMIVGVLGFWMGMPFPSAYQRVLKGGRGHLWPWAFGVNGLFSVIGAPLMMMVLQMQGFMVSIGIVAAMYVFAGGLWVSGCRELTSDPSTHP